MHITVPYYSTIIHISITVIAVAIQTITITNTVVTWCSYSTICIYVRSFEIIQCSNVCNLKPNVKALTIIDTHYLTSSKKWVRQLVYSLITASIDV